MASLGRALYWTLDNVGNGYFVVLATVAVISVVVAIVVAALAGAWAFLLVALCFPAFWLLVWWTS